MVGPHPYKDRVCSPTRDQHPGRYMGRPGNNDEIFRVVEEFVRMKD